MNAACYRAYIQNTGVQDLSASGVGLRVLTGQGATNWRRAALICARRRSTSMRGAQSISTQSGVRRAAGLDATLWHRARSSVYARVRQATTSADAPCRSARADWRRPVTFVLVGHIRRVLRSVATFRCAKLYRKVSCVRS